MTISKSTQKQQQLHRLWGDGGAYSQIRVEREIRILDDKVSRELFYLYANINPTTIEVLKKNRRKITDRRIRRVLDEAIFVNEEEGYHWWLSNRLEDAPDEADHLAKEATKTLCEMHKLVLSILGLEENNKNL